MPCARPGNWPVFSAESVRQHPREPSFATDPNSELERFRFADVLDLAEQE